MKKTLIVSSLLFCAGLLYGQVDNNPAVIVKDANKTVIEVKKEEIKPAADTVKDPNKPVTDVKKEDIKPAADTVKDPNKPVTDIKKEEIKPTADTVKDPNKPVTDIKKEDIKPVADTVKKEDKPATAVKKDEKKPSADTASKSGFIKRLDIGLGAGTVIYGDVLGYNAIFEGRAYMMKLPGDMDLFAGAGIIYQYTESTLHTIDHWYGYALCGADYGGLKNFFPKFKTLLGPLSLRAELAVGGGFTTDENSTGTTTEKSGYILYPSIGADYSFGKVHADIMMGYEIIVVGSAEFTAPAVRIGASYTIF